MYLTSQLKTNTISSSNDYDTNGGNTLNQIKTEDLIPKRLRVGTFNIASYSDPDLLAQNRLITQSKIDVLGLQELD